MIEDFGDALWYAHLRLRYDSGPSGWTATWVAKSSARTACSSLLSTGAITLLSRALGSARASRNPLGRRCEQQGERRGDRSVVESEPWIAGAKTKPTERTHGLLVASTEGRKGCKGRKPVGVLPCTQPTLYTLIKRGEIHLVGLRRSLVSF